MSGGKHKLNRAVVKALDAPGRYGDGRGLYLLIGKTGVKSWVYRYQIFDRRRDMGLGPVSRTNHIEVARTSSFIYNTFSQPVRLTDFGGFVTTIDRDEAGNPLTVTDPLGNRSVQTYNAQGQIETQTDQNGNVTSFGYDNSGNVNVITNAEGEIIEMTRDGAGNIQTITEGATTPEAATSSFTYDALNRISTFTDGEGAMTQFRYDEQGNLSETEEMRQG